MQTTFQRQYMRKGGDILSKINPIPSGGINMLLISELRPTIGVYISKFKVDLAGYKRLIELGYGMDIITFKLLFKLQIYSRNQHRAQKNWIDDITGF